MYRRAADNELEDTVAHKASTAELNPKISEKFLRAQERRNPDSYRSEYMAEFVGSGASFIDFSRIDLSTPAPIARPVDATRWVCGMDPGFARDPYGYALVGRTRSGQLVLGPVGAIKADGAFGGVIDEIATHAKHYRSAKPVTDQFCQAAVVEYFERQHGLKVTVNTMDAKTKTDAYQALRTALYDGSLTLPDHPDLIAELKRLRTRYTPGSAAVENPRVAGSHGDVAQALALAVGELGGSEGESNVWMRYVVGQMRREGTPLPPSAIDFAQDHGMFDEPSSSAPTLPNSPHPVAATGVDPSERREWNAGPYACKHEWRLIEPGVEGCCADCRVKRETEEVWQQRLATQHDQDED